MKSQISKSMSAKWRDVGMMRRKHSEAAIKSLENSESLLCDNIRGKDEEIQDRDQRIAELRELVKESIPWIAVAKDSLSLKHFDKISKWEEKATAMLGEK